MGGGYNTPFNPNSISIKNRTVAKFYLDQFNFLKNMSIPLRKPNNTIDLDLIDYLIKEAEEKEKNSSSLVP